MLEGDGGGVRVVCCLVTLFFFVLLAFLRHRGVEGDFINLRSKTFLVEVILPFAT